MDSGFMQTPFATGLESLLNEESYKNFLRLIADLHDHSNQNQILIALQFPEASFILNYGRWNNFHREIIPYCNGINILAPKYKIKYRYKDTGKPVKSKDMTRDELQESLKMGLVTPVRQIASYSQATVYDIKQTVIELTSTQDTVPSRWNFDGSTDKLIDIIRNKLNINIHIEKSPDTFGVYDKESNTITLMYDGNTQEILEILLQCMAQSQVSGEFSKDIGKNIAISIQYAIECRLNSTHRNEKFRFISDWKSKYDTDSNGREEVQSYISAIASGVHNLLYAIEREYEVDNRFNANEILEDAMREELADDVLSEASANAIQALLGG